jgi:hypothetical protein
MDHKLMFKGFNKEEEWINCFENLCLRGFLLFACIDD